jgi:hypothetical protein
MGWLLREFEAAGGRVERRRVTSFSELSAYDAAVNCAGLGARELAADPSVHAIRGHVVRVRAPWVRHHVEAEGACANTPAYIIPNTETVVLGGTKGAPGDEDTVPRAADREAILRRCAEVVPSLEGAEVVGECEFFFYYFAKEGKGWGGWTGGGDDAWIGRGQLRAAGGQRVDATGVIPCGEVVLTVGGGVADQSLRPVFDPTLRRGGPEAGEALCAAGAGARGGCGAGRAAAGSALLRSRRVGTDARVGLRRRRGGLDKWGAGVSCGVFVWACRCGQHVLGPATASFEAARTSARDKLSCPAI